MDRKEDVKSVNMNGKLEKVSQSLAHVAKDMIGKQKMINCDSCGNGGFRYSRKDRQSYCLTCGEPVNPETLKKVIGSVEELDGGT